MEIGTGSVETSTEINKQSITPLIPTMHRYSLKKARTGISTTDWQQTASDLQLQMARTHRELMKKLKPKPEENRFLNMRGHATEESFQARRARFSKTPFMISADKAFAKHPRVELKQPAGQSGRMGLGYSEEPPPPPEPRDIANLILGGTLSEEDQLAAARSISDMFGTRVRYSHTDWAEDYKSFAERLTQNMIDYEDEYHEGTIASARRYKPLLMEALPRFYGEEEPVSIDVWDAIKPLVHATAMVAVGDEIDKEDELGDVETRKAVRKAFHGKILSHDDTIEMLYLDTLHVTDDANPQHIWKNNRHVLKTQLTELTDKLNKFYTPEHDWNDVETGYGGPGARGLEWLFKEPMGKRNGNVRTPDTKIFSSDHVPTYHHQTPPG